MYGMIHRGIREMVIDRLGKEQWREIEMETGTGPAEQIGLSLYDDAMTLRLLAASASRLGMEVDELLRMFGRYWIRFAAKGAYGEIMDLNGQDIRTFVANLDRMHQVVLAVMPEARMPSFCVLESQEDFLRVRYVSERAGLEIFVVGLFEGLLEKFCLQGHVEQNPEQTKFPEFLIRFTKSPSRRD